MLRLSFCILLSLGLSEVSAEFTVTIVALVPVTGDWPVGKTILGALPLAIEDINNDPNLLSNYTLEFEYQDSECHDGTGLSDALTFREELRDELVVIIGDGCDTVCETVGLLASHWRLPMITWGCGSALLTDMKYYDTLARVVGPYPRTITILMELLKAYGWNRVSVLL